MDLITVNSFPSDNVRLDNHRDPKTQNSVMKELYISPEGNDTNPGTFSEPLRTVKKAQQIVQSFTNGMTGDIKVFLRGGRYEITSPLKFNQSDGGQNQYRVVYTSYQDETPVLDAGKKAEGWERHTNGIWKCYLGSSNFRQLYIKSQSGENHNTNHPNSDDLNKFPYAGKPTSLSVMTPSYEDDGSWERRAIKARENVLEDTFSIDGEGQTIINPRGIFTDPLSWKTPFGEKDTEFPATLEKAKHYLKDIEFVYHLMWNLPRIKVETMVEEGQNQKFIMQQPAYSFARTKGGTKLGDGWPGVYQPLYLENTYEFLNEPGEWYYDRWTGWLFYKPLDSEPQPDSEEIEFYYPSTERIIEVSGNETAPVQNLEFQGLTFKHTNWRRPNEYGKGHIDVQANFLVESTDTGKKYMRSPGALTLEHCQNIFFQNCSFSKFGGAGIDLYEGARYCTIEGCTFDDLSGTAVNIGGIESTLTEESPRKTGNISISNNYFTNIAVEFKGGHAIWAGYVQYVNITHNEISGTAYTPISVGWGWSGTQTVCRDNLVMYNHISNYMMEMKDGGAIYTLSLQNRTRVAYNHIHDGCGSGLYPDEQTWMTTWDHNVVYRSGNSLQDHTMGIARNSTSIRQNNITNNYFDMDPIIEPDRQETHIPNNNWSISSDPSEAVLDIVSDAGLEPEYQGLLTGNESIREKDQKGLYWSDFVGKDTTALYHKHPVLFYLGLLGFIGISLNFPAYKLNQKKDTIKNEVKNKKSRNEDKAKGGATHE